MKTKEEILKHYETYITIGQPHNTTPIFLKENVLNAMEEYVRPYKDILLSALTPDFDSKKTITTIRQLVKKNKELKKKLTKTIL